MSTRRQLTRVTFCAAAALAAAVPASAQVHTFAPEKGEVHLANLRQLTNGGENAEAYWSKDGKWITFQSTRDGRTCDQQYVMRADGSDLRRISDGRGKTTCGWFFPDGKRLFFGASTAHDSACPPRPDPSKGYVWPLDKYDIYTVNRDGSNLKRLTNYNVYTAEGVLSPNGKQIVTLSVSSSPQVWSAENGRHLFSLEGPANRYRAAGFNRDGSRFFYDEYFTRLENSPVHALFCERVYGRNLAHAALRVASHHSVLLIPWTVVAALAAAWTSN